MSDTDHIPIWPATLGGQAVIEGVMIRGPQGAAVCVRRPDGELAFMTERAESPQSMRRLPLVRGVLALAETVSQGMRAMMWSAQVAAGIEPRQPGKGQLRVMTAVSLGAASGLFLLAPALAARRLERRRKPSRFSPFVEGFVRIGTLIGYLRTVGRMPQAQRLFGYHGAEHRAIQAYEAGEPLEVDSLRQFPNAHVRCGTSFLLTTTLISSLVYAAVGPQTLGKRLLARVALLPLIAGLSYEAIRLGTQARGPIRLLFRPNIALQSLTTRDPDEEQMEVALAALRAALALHDAR
jgi:uncharacterized protein YqhQ